MGGVSASGQQKGLTLHDYQECSSLKHWLTCTLCNDVKGCLCCEVNIELEEPMEPLRKSAQWNRMGRASCALMAPHRQLGVCSFIAYAGSF